MKNIFYIIGLGFLIGVLLYFQEPRRVDLVFKEQPIRIASQ